MSLCEWFADWKKNWKYVVKCVWDKLRTPAKCKQMKTYVRAINKEQEEKEKNYKLKKEVTVK